MNRHVKEALTEFATSMLGFAGVVALLYYFRAWTVPAVLWLIEMLEKIVTYF
jgi:hypothetical protein